MPLPEGEIWRPMWPFNVMLLAFTNARKAGGGPARPTGFSTGSAQDREVRSPPQAICFHFFALTL